MFHILVVEDNRDLRELFCSALNENGYRALDADNGERALEILSDTVIDLIVADIMMPVQTALLSRKNIHAAAVDGRNLGHGFGNGRIYPPKRRRNTREKSYPPRINCLF